MNTSARDVAVVGLALIGLLTTACGGDDDAAATGEGGSGSGDTATTTTSSAAEEGAAPVIDPGEGGDYDPQLSPADLRRHGRQPLPAVHPGSAVDLRGDLRR